MLRLTTVIAIVVAALALPAVAPAAPSAAKVEKCGKKIVNGGGWWKLTAEKISCKKAKKLANYYVFEAGGADIGVNPRFREWVCAKARLADEVWQVQCSRQMGTKDQVVTFRYGA